MASGQGTVTIDFGGGQAVTVPLLVNSSTLYSSKLGLNLLVQFLTNSSVVLAPAIQPGTVNLTLPIISAADQLYIPVVFRQADLEADPGTFITYVESSSVIGYTESYNFVQLVPGTYYITLVDNLYYITNMESSVYVQDTSTATTITKSGEVAYV